MSGQVTNTEPSQLKLNPIVGTSQAAIAMREFAQKASETDHTLLLCGESGVGKDYLAELTHYMGRKNHAFVPVDCGVLTETLSETELFGHTRGAFTDARIQKQGLVQVAERGTLFFNEVANMSLTLQAKFLRILEKKSYREVGGTREYFVNTRIIAATNADLVLGVKEGKIRADLYHRLNGISITIPPLRNRPEDIPVLVKSFLEQEGCGFKTLSAESLKALREYSWPGNIRELRNMLMRAIFLSDSDREISVQYITPYFLDFQLNSTDTIGDETTHKDGKLLTLKDVQKAHILKALERSGGNITKAAKILGMSKNGLFMKLQRMKYKK